MRHSSWKIDQYCNGGNDGCYNARCFVFEDSETEDWNDSKTIDGRNKVVRRSFDEIANTTYASERKQHGHYR